MNFNRGSEWRKWDLHVHTPYAFLKNEFGDPNQDMTWDNYIKSLFRKAIDEKIYAIGITDYFSLDGYEKVLSYIEDTSKLSKPTIGFSSDDIEKIKNILILPNIEFRIKCIVGSNRVNFHVIFSNEIALRELKENFLETLTFVYQANPSAYEDIRKLTKNNLITLGQRLKEDHDEFKSKSDIEIGAMNAVIDDQKITEALIKNNQFKDKYLIVIPVDEDLSKIKWDSQDHLVKKILYQKSNCFFSSNQGTIDFGLGKKHATEEDFILEFKSIKPCLHGSDAHSIEKIFKPDLDRFCWIKADLTYNGLMHACLSPSERIFIGNEPQKLKDVSLNKTKYINTIKISHEENMSNIWFDSTLIELNHGLVSIIGNKGSGKSALSDIIGLLGNSYNYNSFSFLHKNKFLALNNIAGKHNAELLWENQLPNQSQPTKIPLDQAVNHQSLERVRYIPQNYFETICNLTDTQEEFRKEIEKVTFTHIKEEERLGAKDFNELIELKNKSLEIDLQRIKTDLNNAIDKYVVCENELSNSNTSLNSSKFEEYKQQKQSIEIEIKALQIPPKPVSQESNENLQIILKNLKIKEDNLIAEKEKLNLTIKNLQIIKDILDNIKTFKLNHDTFIKQLNLNLEQIGLTNSSSKIVELLINIVPLEDKKKILINEQSAIATSISTIEKEIENLKISKKSEEAKLSGETKIYQEYINKKNDLEKKLQIILGNNKQPNENQETYYYYEYVTSQEYLSAKQIEKDSLYTNILKYSGEMFDKLLEKKDIYKSLGTNVEGYINEFKKIPDADIKIEFNTNISIMCTENKFEDRIMNYIDKRNDFYGDKRDITLKKLFYDVKLDTKENFTSMCDSFVKKITDSEEKTITPALKQGDSDFCKEFYKYLFSTEYLEINYKLKFNEKTISVLSPGERGLLLLIFFLIADKSDIPLILDQPEENLDNQTIKKILVPMIKHTKENRQLIIVTHNPNLAVVCDSDQIIHSEFKAERTPKVKYLSGSIENPNMNTKIVDILEGTMPAFRIRDSKYLEKI